jgi:hypothetical protein
MTTSTLTVTEFVLARIAEDEAGALRRAQDREAEPYWRVDPAMQAPSRDGRVVTGYLKTESPEDRRVLAQCAAMRKIVELHRGFGRDEEWAPEGYCECEGTLASPCATVRALASIWSDHPQFDPAWA